MTSPQFEAFLALIYVDTAAREQFLADPMRAARAAGLTDTECEALASIDREGLQMAAQSFARKRQKQKSHPVGLSRRVHDYRRALARMLAACSR